MENRKQTLIYLCEEVTRLEKALELVTASRLEVIKQSEVRRQEIWDLKNKIEMDYEAFEAVVSRLFVIRGILMSAVNVEDDTEWINLEELATMAAKALEEKKSVNMIDITPSTKS